MAAAAPRRSSDDNPAAPIVFRSPLVAFDTTKPLPPRVPSTEDAPSRRNSGGGEESKGDDSAPAGAPAAAGAAKRTEGWLFKDLGNIEELVEDNTTHGFEDDSLLFSGDDNAGDPGEPGFSTSYSFPAGGAGEAASSVSQQQEQLVYDMQMQQQMQAAAAQQQAMMQYQMMMAGVGGYPVFTADQLSQMMPPGAAAQYFPTISAPQVCVTYWCVCCVQHGARGVSDSPLS